MVVDCVNSTFVIGGPLVSLCQPLKLRSFVPLHGHFQYHPVSSTECDAYLQRQGQNANDRSQKYHIEGFAIQPFRKTNLVTGKYVNREFAQLR
jgi:hypothetical protein